MKSQQLYLFYIEKQLPGGICPCFNVVSSCLFQVCNILFSDLPKAPPTAGPSHSEETGAC